MGFGMLFQEPYRQAGGFVFVWFGFGFSFKSSYVHQLVMKMFSCS
jgi:hypothetical protein